MFYKGKHTCKILKDIRRQIAQENDISLIIEECTYKGDCLGTCPRCEAEVRYLEEQLRKRQSAGKALKVAGISAAMISLLAPSCAPVSKRPAPPPETEGLVEPLEGDVVYVPEDLPEEDSSTSTEKTNAEATEGRKTTKKNKPPKRSPLPDPALRGRVAPPREPEEREYPLEGEPAIDIPEPQTPDTPKTDTPEVVIRDPEPLMGIVPIDIDDREIVVEKDTTQTNTINDKQTEK